MRREELSNRGLNSPYNRNLRRRNVNDVSISLDSGYNCSTPVPVDSIYEPGPFPSFPMFIIKPVGFAKAKANKSVPRDKKWTTGEIP